MATERKAVRKPDRIIQITLRDIRTRDGTQSRAELNSETASQYAEAMKNGAVFPNMSVFYGVDDRTPDDPKKYYWLAAGFHRYEAFDQNGTRATMCDVYDGSRRDAILFSVAENHAHGLQRTNADKRHAVRLLLEDREWRKKSNNWIAEMCHVSRSVVEGVWEVMEAERQVAEEKRKEAEAAARAKAVEEALKKNKPKPPPSFSDEEEEEETEEAEESSLADNASENPPRVREGRSRHGGTRKMNTANIGKNTKGVKPVVIEREKKQIIILEKQEARSFPKWLRQWKRLGRTLEGALQRVRDGWDEIPVMESDC